MLSVGRACCPQRATGNFQSGWFGRLGTNVSTLGLLLAVSLGQSPSPSGRGSRIGRTQNYREDTGIIKPLN